MANLQWKYRCNNFRNLPKLLELHTERKLAPKSNRIFKLLRSNIQPRNDIFQLVLDIKWLILHAYRTNFTIQCFHRNLPNYWSSVLQRALWFFNRKWNFDFLACVIHQSHPCGAFWYILAIDKSLERSPFQVFGNNGWAVWDSVCVSEAVKHKSKYSYIIIPTLTAQAVAPFISSFTIKDGDNGVNGKKFTNMQYHLEKFLSLCRLHFGLYCQWCFDVCKFCLDHLEIKSIHRKKWKQSSQSI